MQPIGSIWVLVLACLSVSFVNAQERPVPAGTLAEKTSSKVEESVNEDATLFANPSSRRKEIMQMARLEPLVPEFNSKLQKILQTQTTPAQQSTGDGDPQDAGAMNQLGAADAEQFSNQFNDGRRFGVGVDLYSPPEFKGGLIVLGDNIAMKFGGMVKADFIYDFNAIDSTDTFDTTSIPIGVGNRTNARFHARQTRLSMDTRWVSNEKKVRFFVEGDFFSEGNRFRLRHAYGEVGSLLVGQTWTTFTDVSAVPATLDFEGSVSSVNRRQALARWTQRLLSDDLTFAVAVEDTQFIIEEPSGVSVVARSPSPDFVWHLRLQREWGRFQLGGLYRLVGVQPTGASIPVFGDEVGTGTAWGTNFTGAVLISERTKFYYQVLFGDGIGSYRGLPDAAPSATDNLAALPLFGWMVGFTHEWRDDLSSNFTYAANSLDNTSFQLPDDVHRTTYLAVNLIHQRLDRVRYGIEYLYGTRENVDRGKGAAHRLQMAIILSLP